MSDGIRRIACSNKNGEAVRSLEANIKLINGYTCSLENLRAYFLLKKVDYDSSKKSNCGQYVLQQSNQTVRTCHHLMRNELLFEFRL
jgi:hypothetical protein